MARKETGEEQASDTAFDTKAVLPHPNSVRMLSG